jgi:hypothetical protein
MNSWLRDENNHIQITRYRKRRETLVIVANHTTHYTKITKLTTRTFLFLTRKQLLQIISA